MGRKKQGLKPSTTSQGEKLSLFLAKKIQQETTRGERMNRPSTQPNIRVSSELAEKRSNIPSIPEPPCPSPGWLYRFDALLRFAAASVVTLEALDMIDGVELMEKNGANKK